MRLTPILFCSALVFTNCVHAQERENLPSATSPMDKVRNDTQVYETQRTQPLGGTAVKAQCMQVTALEAYCSCLQARLPASFTFDNYVVVLSRSKQDNGYARMDKSARKIYDAMPQVRDACAAMLSPK